MAFGRDPVAPPLRVGEYPLRPTIVGAAGIQSALDGQRVAVSHQFADQLFLPAQRPVCANLRRGEHCLTQAFFDRQCAQLFLGQFDQPLAELLQFELLSF